MLYVQEVCQIVVLESGAEIQWGERIKSEAMCLIKFYKSVTFLSILGNKTGLSSNNSLRNKPSFARALHYSLGTNAV